MTEPNTSKLEGIEFIESIWPVYVPWDTPGYRLYLLYMAARNWRSSALEPATVDEFYDSYIIEGSLYDFIKTILYKNHVPDNILDTIQFIGNRIWLQKIDKSTTVLKDPFPNQG